MKFIRKLITMVLAACMILTVSGIAALAANSSETATVTVTGLDENASITLYKIADATYNDAGDTFTGYSYLQTKPSPHRRKSTTLQQVSRTERCQSLP